jgi:predicted dehydrogenase/threonine dehydrogenase-like Zn-dependent dehydrogenase
MKQIVQHLNNGATLLEEIPAPILKDGHLLIQTACSLVSSGTERMLVSFGKANWVQKAIQQPDRVKLVLDKLKTDGWKPTVNAVFNKINKPIPLGYSNAGTVIAIGKGVSGFKIGDRVASNGPHAEVVVVPQKLVAKIPDNVTDEEASFTVVAAIALQGIRLVNPTFGETIVVIGLGLIGQITTQLLQANGCKVIGIDTDPSKCKLAEQFGVKSICSQQEQNSSILIRDLTNNIGADAVIITASSKSNDVIAQAAQMSRKRGRIVLVGVVGLDINRSDFYEKELSFQVSCSYGPGRYDYDYEQKAQDYPIGFVRWTEQRNFEAVLQAIACGQLNVQQLIAQQLPIAEYQKVYEHIARHEAIATIFKYDLKKIHTHSITVAVKKSVPTNGTIAMIGAGNFASNIIVPTLQKCRANIKTIVSEHGLTATHLAKKYGISNVTTDVRQVFSDHEISTVIIATRHNTHAQLCIDALNAGKHVFVEKPLALSISELDAISVAYRKSKSILMVGFNRRFAPFALKMKELLGASNAAMNIVVNVNAGILPDNHWLGDKATSGGRIIGEVCHFIDFCSYLTASDVEAVCTNSMGNSEENVSILLRYANGTNAVINYFANGSKAYDKERIEVYQQEKTLVLENWKKLTGFGFKGFSSVTGAQDKGHYNQFKLFYESIKNGVAVSISFDSIMNTSKAAIAAAQSMQENAWTPVQ